MLILLVSVTSWTTELALKALDAEIDAAEKAVDSCVRSSNRNPISVAGLCELMPVCVGVQRA